MTETRRSLRLSVDPETYAQLEKLAKWTGTSLAKTTEFIIAFGLGACDAMTDPEREAS